MAEKSNYRLRAGVIINCPNFRGGKIYTNDNLTDKVASEFLKMFPEQEVLFQKLPPKNTKTPKDCGKVDEISDSENPEETPESDKGGNTDGSDGDGAKEGDQAEE